jgi:amino acid adenylation domain-containing protein
MKDAAKISELAGAMHAAPWCDSAYKIPKCAPAGSYPLSFGQQRLWFLDQMLGGMPVYNLPLCYHLAGPLNVDALEQSLQAIAERHESLRTTFRLVEGEPVQVMAQESGFQLDQMDLQDQSWSQREMEAWRRIEAEARRPFDLEHGPLFRALLLSLGEQDHYLLINQHHIVTDGWSLTLFRRELSTLYEAFVNGRSARLVPLPIQYADFAIWQRGRLQGERLEAELSYWRRQLDGVPWVLELPGDHPRPSAQSYRGARERIVLPARLGAALRDFSRQERATVFMTLLAVFEVLIWRYTRQDDFLVGTPVAGRAHLELEELMGFFVNTLPLRDSPVPTLTFRELLSQVRETVIDAQTHQDLPFDRLVDALQPERELSRSPLVQVLFTFEPNASDELELAGLRVCSHYVSTATAKFDLHLETRQTAHELEVAAEYATDIFDTDTIKHLLGHYQTVLEAALTDPGRAIAALPLLTAPERRQLLGEWNRQTTRLPNDRLVHQLFELQVEKTPERTAVVASDGSLSYQELNKRANQVAHYLAGLGLGGGHLVGICMERSWEVMVGLLGILKSGAAYLPLDDHLPLDRLRFMIEDACPQLVLTQDRVRHRLPMDAGTLVCLDKDWDRIEGEPHNNPSWPVSAGQLVYVLYTSGSTGKPKGVMISHAGLANCLQSLRALLVPLPEDVFLALTTLSFDMAAVEIYLPLITGSCVHLGTSEAAQDPAALAAIIVDSRATILQATPATWQLLHVGGWPPARVRHLLSGGEALPPELIPGLLEHAAHVWNLYGPTETTIYSTGWQVGAASRPVLIGTPLANTSAYVVDASLELVPVGVVGELLLGGVGLAHGYLNRPDLTAERFVPDPFSDVPGSRLYRSGDLARYRPNGTLEYLGRIDHQVKLRGFRIEPGEIEATLRQHSGVRESLVLLREDQPGDRRLVAYVTTRPGLASDPAALRSYLVARLPEYMVPSAYVILDAFPLTPTGKVDRRALPKPTENDLVSADDFTAPRTPTEETISRAWCEMLGLSRVSVTTGFFEAGGDSLAAARVVSRLRAAFDVDVTLRDLFETRTIAGLSARIEQMTST